MKSSSTAWCVGQTNICALTAAYLNPAVVKDIFGPNTGILAWDPGEAKVVPGGYRLTGNFDFASGSRLATWLGAHVPVIEPDGSKSRAIPNTSKPSGRCCSAANRTGRCLPSDQGQACKNPTRSPSRMAQVSRPPITAPVSMPMRLVRTTGTFVGV